MSVKQRVETRQGEDKEILEVVNQQLNSGPEATGHARVIEGLRFLFEWFVVEVGK